MALLSYPLALADFFDLLPAGTVTFDLPDSLDVSRTGGGEVLAADLGTRLWTGQIDLGVMTHAEAAAVVPLLRLIRAAGASFFVADHTRLAPRLDPGGVILGAAEVEVLEVGTSWREIALSGLPVGYALSRGDLIAFAYGSSPTRHALHELVGSAVADGDGETGLVELSAPFRPGLTEGTPVTLVRAACKARLEPGSASPGKSANTITSGASLRWVQTLR